MTCTSSNINPLYNSYFTLSFGRGTKQLELNCQKANLPGCTVPDVNQPTIFGTTIPVPTMQFNYETLNIEFIVDSKLENWQSIYSWMRNISNIDTDTEYNLDYQDWHQEANLIIYDPATNAPLTRVTFYYIVPTKLNGLIFQTDSADAIIQKAACQFKYSYYEFCPDVPGNLLNTL
jgi:hypothetical protein